MKVFEKCTNTFRTILKWWSYIGAAGLFVMVALIFIDVILRYFFGAPITGSQEMSQLLMVVIMFCGMPYAAAKGSLLAVDAITRKFKPSLRKIMRIFFYAICAFVAVMMCIKNFAQMVYYVNNPLLTTSILKLSYVPFYAIATVGLGLLAIEMALEVAINIIEAVKHKEGKEAAEIE